MKCTGRFYHPLIGDHWAQPRLTAAGLINFMRNIGSSIGTSFVTTLISRRSQFHQVHLVDGIATDNPMFQDQMSVLANRLAVAGLSTYEAHRQAYARFYVMVQEYAQTLAYIDTFWLLALIAAIMFGLSFALKKNDPRGAGTVAAH